MSFETFIRHFHFQKHQYLGEITYVQDDFFGKLFFLFILDFSFSTCLLIFLLSHSRFFVCFFFPLRTLARSPSNFMLKLLAGFWPDLVFCMPVKVNGHVIQSVTGCNSHTPYLVSESITHMLFKTNMPH